jgi:hypothetical protein
MPGRPFYGHAFRYPVESSDYVFLSAIAIPGERKEGCYSRMHAEIYRHPQFYAARSEAFSCPINLHLIP